jgi:hypothetical protein
MTADSDGFNDVHDDVVFHMATDVAADLDDNNDVDIDVA